MKHKMHILQNVTMDERKIDAGRNCQVNVNVVCNVIYLIGL